MWITFKKKKVFPRFITYAILRSTAASMSVSNDSADYFFIIQASDLGPSEGQTAVMDVCCLLSLHH